jgi:hypothetical protein
MSSSPGLDGLADSAGFIVGALLGFGLGRLLGFDVFAEGYGIGTIIGIALVGVGGGAGVQLSRAWRTSRQGNR